MSLYALQQVWTDTLQEKMDVMLEEPNRIISLWLAMGLGKIPN